MILKHKILFLSFIGVPLYSCTCFPGAVGSLIVKFPTERLPRPEVVGNQIEQAPTEKPPKLEVVGSK